MYTVLVYANVPESTDFYVIPDDEISPRQRGWLEEAQNKLINSDKSNEGMRALSDMLATEKEHCSNEFADAYRCCWAKYKQIPVNPIILDHATTVYFSGFIL